MSPLGVVLAAALTSMAPAGEQSQLAWVPFAQQGVLLFLSDEVTSGGLAAGAGAQFIWRGSYVAQADISALLGIGNTWSTRLAVGLQRDGFWAPAAWGTTAILFGDRVETLTSDGRRPAVPNWAIGVRGSPLRFMSRSAVFSALEPGIGTDLAGGVLFDLTLVQVGAWW